MDKLYIIKIGGNIIDDEEKLASFLKKFAAIEGKKILVHGGGKLATKMAEEMNIPQQMVEGRRITDAGTLRIVTMVYAGYINKNIVSQLQSEGCNALGLSGADGNAVLARKRSGTKIDYGFAGDVEKINSDLFQTLLEKNISPVVAPITHNGKGQLLNTNADTMAREMSTELSSHYEVHLIFSFEKPGVLLDASDETSVLREITPAYYQKLKEEKKVFAGMIPKLDNAFAALDRGVTRVVIGKAEEINQLVKGEAGTSIVKE
ncbi:MAG: acetylglutamate kinase [Flavisolibacter sp.]